MRLCSPWRYGERVGVLFFLTFVLPKIRIVTSCLCYRYQHRCVDNEKEKEFVLQMLPFKNLITQFPHTHTFPIAI